MTPGRTRNADDKNMVRVPGGRFLMGSVDFYPEEAPVHEREVEGFWMDETPVTVAMFRRFVKATGHVTTAERAPDPALYPDASPDQLVPGSLVFTPPRTGCRWTTSGAGGRGCRGRSGGTLRDRAPVSTAATCTRSRTSPRGRHGVRHVGGQGAADRGGVGARVPRWARGRDVRVG